MAGGEQYQHFGCVSSHVLCDCEYCNLFSLNQGYPPLRQQENLTLPHKQMKRDNIEMLKCHTVVRCPHGAAHSHSLGRCLSFSCTWYVMCVTRLITSQDVRFISLAVILAKNSRVNIGVSNHPDQACVPFRSKRVKDLSSYWTGSATLNGTQPY